MDHDAIALLAKENKSKQTIDSLSCKPKIVVTDSYFFLKVDADTPPDVLLTSFSILFARYKGGLEAMVTGAKALDKLKPGDTVLATESCTHHRVEDDIGTVTIPHWIRQHVGGELQLEWVSGTKFSEDIAQY